MNSTEFEVAPLTRAKFYAGLLALLVLPWQSLNADTINIAVASNFAAPMGLIKDAFESQSEHQLKLIKSSSGKLYAQISRGAPFDIFLSADQQRPRLLEEQGHAIAGSRRTYAIGRLALWSGQEGLAVNAQLLEQPASYRKLAIPNPKLAPYGEASVQVLSALGVLDSVRDKLLMGENVAQAFQFAFSGGAELGFVAYSQALAITNSDSYSYWLVPDTLHQPIRQDMVLLTDSSLSRQVEKFITGEVVAAILRNNGYLVPAYSNSDSLKGL